MARLRQVALMAAATLGGSAMADTVVLNYSGSYQANSGAPVYSGAVRFTMDDTAGTMTIRIQNTTAGANTIRRDISAFFWSFSGTAMDVRGANANAAYSSTANGGVIASQGYNAAQMWAFHDPAGSPQAGNWPNSPQQATQGLGAAGLGGLWQGNNSAEILQGGASGQVDGPDGTLISAAGNQYANGANQFRDFVQFTFTGLAGWYQGYGGASHVQVSRMSLQFDTDRTGPNVVLVPLPPAAFAGLGSLAGLAVLTIVRRRSHLQA